MFRQKRTLLTVLALLLGSDGRALAQPFEEAGVRALGLGGAFVAVADDASAVWWNPAGLASGPFFNLILERQARRREPDPDASLLTRSAIDQSVTGFALATPPLGLSYYRTRYTAVPAADERIGRESGNTPVRSLVTHQTGVTLAHSLTSALVVGSTLKFVRGVAAAGMDVERRTGAVLDRAADLVGRATNRFDADLGIHWNAGVLRAGLTVRHLAEPSFKAVDGQTFTLERQARAGAALALGAETTLSTDVDLTEQREDLAGRRVAFGIERRWLPRFALRGGVRTTTRSEGEKVFALGGSVAVRPGIWVDGFWSRGQDDDSRWGVAGRVAY